MGVHFAVQTVVGLFPFVMKEICTVIPMRDSFEIKRTIHTCRRLKIIPFDTPLKDCGVHIIILL